MITAHARRMDLWPLFLISASSVGYEIALTRYFAVAQFSEYGYWIISIAMAGFALSGVGMAVWRGAAVRHGHWLRAWLPPVLVAAAGLGYVAALQNPFNPLQLQNLATARAQLVHIGLYYLCFLPFFCLAGLYIALCFVLREDQPGQVYAYDLTGAAAGGALVLALTFGLHPFHLVPALLVVIALAALPTRRLGPIALTLVLLLGCQILLGRCKAHINDYKPIYAPLHVQGARSLAEQDLPRGVYTLLDDFTERVDTDISNDAGMLGFSGPPRGYGVYRDGARIATLPFAAGAKADYAQAALDAAPYGLFAQPHVLIEGASGGFRLQEALALGARHVDAIEPDPVLLRALRHGWGASPAMPADPRIALVTDHPLQPGTSNGGYDLIDISADFLDEAEANRAAYTVEALAADLHALAPGGLISIPVSIRDFPAYALRMLATVRQALRQAGIAVPSRHVVVIRSAWNLRILFGPSAWTDAQLRTIRDFCEKRSFDLSYYPGMDVRAARDGLFNDLPPVSLETGMVDEQGPRDAIADEAGPVLGGEATASSASFNLSPITLDRPAYYALLRPLQWRTLLRRIEILPQPEIAQLINLVVLVQALVLALAVLSLPLLARRRLAENAGAESFLRAAVFFPALGLGFLFLEIALIEQASLYLADRATAFALVLTGMLLFSGLGALLADRIGRGAMVGAVTVIVVFCVLGQGGLQFGLLHTIGLPIWVRMALLLLVIAPVSLALGLPFPLGLRRLARGGALPWAWALNGAFSVVATPLANLLVGQFGIRWVLLAAALLYGLGLLAYLPERKTITCQNRQAA